MRILDKIDNLESNNNIVMNENPGISINIYKSDINLNEIKNYDKNKNITFINLDECENKLRKYYNINDDQKFCIISVDIPSKFSNKSTNDFVYEIYLENGTQIKDLSPCYEDLISISSPIMNLDLVHFKEAVIFYSQGYNIHNLSSNFYNDKCTAAYINGNDIIIKDRIDDIYPYNVSFCPKSCRLNNTEINKKRFNCSCNISFIENLFVDKENEDIHLNLQNDDNNYFIYLSDMLNYKLFGCPQILINSSFKDYISNIGLYLGGIVILFNIIALCIFYSCFLFTIRTEIYKLIPTKIKLREKIVKIKKRRRKNTKNDVKNNKFSNPIYKKSGNNSKTNLTSIKYERKKIKSKIKKIKLNQNDSTKNSNIKFNKSKFNNKNVIFKSNILTQNNKLISIEKNMIKKIELNDEDIDPNYYNNIPYTQALRIDKRNIFVIFFSLIKMKIEIITIIFYPEEFTNRFLLLSIYFLEFLFSYFMNAFLYSDDVVSQKYHNNGKLDFITSLSLSLMSNIISSIAIWIIKKITNYYEYFQNIVKNVQKERIFMYLFKKIYKFMKIQILAYFILNFIICFCITYYLLIFCIIYKKSQISLLINYFLSVVEYLIKSFSVSLIACIIRFISLKIKSRRLYRTSIYLDKYF